MKILFVTKLMATAAAGPNWSVPARIKAQSEIDNIFWVNVDNSIMPHWVATELYHSLKDIGGKLTLNNLPADFSKPDIVVFEVPFFIEYLRFASELRKKHIPYIIVPRCSFTRQALNNHAKWKKKIAGWLLFNRFFKGATAIQYLTEQEKRDSSPFLCPNDFVLPNGITLPPQKGYVRKSNEINGVFIGRIDIYHKGLDILLDAVTLKAEFLRSHNVVIHIYGPKNEDYEKLYEKAKEKNVEDLFQLKGKIEGIDKENVLREADFFIMTSRFEGLPMAMLEALSFSVPCIATDGTYFRKEIEAHEAGIGCDGTPEEVGDAIVLLISNINNIKEYRDNAYKLASKYRWDEQAKTFHQMVYNILKSKGFNLEV